ncbi:glycosyl transferase family 36 [Dehalobacter sp. DCM]|uniref:GH36-type glycosyl hydrolase domain-containing protein n=1 Tax=Dehalobacter sp. DCM TaxID=2907827 RepID=UPI003081B366|nr:glycosyl transferase family 36 [Dehalobacter sp. DCM]
MIDQKNINTAQKDVNTNFTELAQFHNWLGLTHKGQSLMPALRRQCAFIRESYIKINEYYYKTEDVIPAAEWYLDNYYIISDLITALIKDISKQYESKLFYLKGSDFNTHPRVYLIVEEFIKQSPHELNFEYLKRCIDAYQDEAPLSSAEIWAIPIMLKVLLLDKIFHHVERIVYIQDERTKADRWLESIFAGNETTPADIEFDPERSVSTVYMERIARKLRDFGSDAKILLNWLDNLASRQNMTVEKAVNSEHHYLTAQGASMGNTITTIKQVNSENWSAFFENVSLVQQALQRDPANIFNKMDFDSRDRYRHEIETIARKYKVSEIIVAKTLEKMASEGKIEPCNHVGFYLFGVGKVMLEQELALDWGRVKKSCHGVYCYLKLKPTLSYLGMIGLFTLAPFLLFTAWLSASVGNNPNTGITVAAGILGLIGSLILINGMAVYLVNRLFCRMMTPAFLPKLYMDQGIPKECKTIVAVPAIFSDPVKVKEQLAHLEVCYLSNQDKNIYYVLLGDFTDAYAAVTPSDNAIVTAGINGVKKLNQRYGEERFFYFHRERQWNDRDQIWMGWERKRGKLIEFNKYLLNDGATSYTVISGNPQVLQGTRYVITLDADTILPRDAAHKLVGTITHPMNKAKLGAKNKILYGYGIIQPRISLTAAGAFASPFSKIFTGAAGVDPYTCAISDIYQDLFGEGIFTGKGIYDLQVFHTKTKDTFPDNRILSHDLIEGLHARTALATDIELFDGYPSKYLAHAKRTHRWIRGDWQIARYLFDPAFSAVSKWKIADNLRRSLEAPFQIAILFLAFTALFRYMIPFIVLFLFSLWLPLIVNLFSRIIDGSLTLRIFKHELKLGMGQILFSAAVLPYQAYMQVDAIIRSLTRQTVTKRKLLEWETAADSEQHSKLSPRHFYLKMLPGLLIAAFFVSGYFFGILASHLILTAFIASWLLSPWIAYRMSVPYSENIAHITEEERQELRLFARQTWAYFDNLVNEVNHYLPPDNIQIEPDKGVANRTSPTNIGLALLANLAAEDLGYISKHRMLQKLNASVHTIKSLPKWNGHIYNWYNTETLEPLYPIYISTVDSGNMAGYMIALKNGLLEINNKPLFGLTLWEGLRDTAITCRELEQKKISKHSSLEKNLNQRLSHIEDFIQEVNHILAHASEEQPWSPEQHKKQSTSEKSQAYGNQIDLYSSYTFISRWLNLLKETDEQPNALAVEDAGMTVLKTNSQDQETDYWSNALVSALSDYKDAMKRYFPYLKLYAQQRSDNHQNTTPAALPEELMQLGQLSLKDLIIAYYQLIQKSQEKISRELFNSLAQGYKNTILLMLRSSKLRRDIEALAYGMDFKPLFDEQKKLFTIGYNFSEKRLDKSYYDLLASEARQTSLWAIAKGDVPEAHWFKMSRPLTRINGKRCLVSWSGTMFEFLMPSILFRNFRGTLMDESYQSVVKIQKEHALKSKTPWGISESGFYSFDIQNNYQYKAFGVPGLGLKRGLSKDMVISPYATFMALPIDFQGSLSNVRQMKAEGFSGIYGLYEAIDYTRSRVPYNEKQRIVKSYMSHHQGMSFIALSNVINANKMQMRFHREPRIKSIELLLQEQVPLKEYTFNPMIEEIGENEVRAISGKLGERPVLYYNPNTRVPRPIFMSNREYAVMMTLSGSGYSQYNKLFLTRWRKDPTQDMYGTFIYVQNLNSGNSWSVTAKPSETEPDEYKVTCFPNTVTYHRKDGNIITQTQVFVPPDDSIEIRRIALTNLSTYSRDIQLTSYVEVALDEHLADLAHPTFSKLFVQTLFENDTLIAYRRPRHIHKSESYMMHALYVEEQTIGVNEFETDRTRFIGRGRTLSDPKVMDLNQPLSNSVGAVLDPILSLRTRVKVDPGRTVVVYYLTGYGEDKAAVINLAHKYRSNYVINQAKELSWSQNLMELTNLNMSFDFANMISSLAGQILYGNPNPNSRYVSQNKKGQSSLWPFGISGDLPIVILKIQDNSQLKLVDQLLTIHEYWKIKGLFLDLVIINEDKSGYFQSIQEVILEKISISHVRKLVNKPGGVFLLKSDQISKEDITLLHMIASMIFTGEKGSLNNQIHKTVRHNEQIIVENTLRENEFDNKETQSPESVYGSHAKFNHHELLFFNGYGGFSQDGREYVILNEMDKMPPLPWVNVIANERFGTIISEAGASFSWAENSREYKLSPWSNDPLLDISGEAIYIKDESSGQYWSPLPQPARDNTPYIVRHGQGYSIFEHSSYHLEQKTTVFVPLNYNLKIIALQLTNKSPLPLRLSVYYYLEWVLGVSKEQNNAYLFTEFKDETIYCRNGYQEEFAGRVAFLSVIGGNLQASTTDRSEFIGINHSLKNPAGIIYGQLSGKTGVNHDPCAVLQTIVDLKPEEEKTVYFLLGDAGNFEKARQLKDDFRDVGQIQHAFEEVTRFWDNVLSVIQVKTPDPAFDLLINRWLVYQTIVCRIWARSGFYQTGGAFGFRDQLQDAMALTLIRPDLTRKQIVLHSSRQFPEGDVQHWWHPETGKGIRTKFSDDLLWLPYVTADYIEHTGDSSVLDEQTPYLGQENLGEFEDERYNVPKETEHTGSIYEHCVRAIDKSLKFGLHGLPLIGTGDWNDGFSAVGREGKGESVWLGWFLLSVLKRFIPLCAGKGDTVRVETYNGVISTLTENMEKNAWDGSWYRRAYYDDATPMGSITALECQIDTIAQSWAVLSGNANKNRAVDAMLAMERYLWDKEEGLLKLLTPPFDKTDRNPGYIKGYIPGVRENGGQYTHAAIWAVLAYCKLGEGGKAMELFSMLNPINHARTNIEVNKYKVEPYVIAADVYAVPPNTGRGGWSWYTGAAGWMYQTAIEGILGIAVTGDEMTINPCIPLNWDTYTIEYKYQSSVYHIVITVNQSRDAFTPAETCAITMDNHRLPTFPIKLKDDGHTHRIEVAYN